MRRKVAFWSNFFSKKFLCLNNNDYLCTSNAENQNYTYNILLIIKNKTNKAMTKAEIVKQIAETTGTDKATVLNVVEAFMATVKEDMINGEDVYLRGFGSFILKKRAKKTARNISKNTTLIIPEHNIPAFKPAKTFLNAVAEAK